MDILFLQKNFYLEIKYCTSKFLREPREITP